MSAVTFTTDQVIKGISNCSNTKAFAPDKLSIFHLKNLDPERLNTSHHSSMTPSHHAESRRFGSHLLSSLSPNSARTLLLELHIGQSHFSARQRKLWRLPYLPLLTHTCSQLLTNTDSEPDTQ